MISRSILGTGLQLSLLLFLLARAGAIAQISTPLPVAEPSHSGFVSFVQPETTPIIPAGKASAVQLHFQISSGMHINSHHPDDDNLIPTRLAITELNGLKVTGVDFPPGANYSFAFDPSTKLNVYTGEFVLTAHVNAAAGAHLLQGVLRYQACDNASCFPPRTLPIALSITAR